MDEPSDPALNIRHFAACRHRAAWQRDARRAGDQPDPARLTQAIARLEADLGCRCSSGAGA
jgi:hypothetical protein